jgi:ribonucleoside-diphosphate reductase alpha chain
MKVIKRNGLLENVMLEKITKRISSLQSLSNELLNIDPIKISIKVVEGLYDGVTTASLDKLAAEISASMITDNYDYGTLAARIEVSNLHKCTPKRFSVACSLLESVLSSDLTDIVKRNSQTIDSWIVHERDYNYDYFACRTLLQGYLLKKDDIVIERPQYMLMRVSLAIHGEDLESARNTYELMSNKYFTHATPTLFNAGTVKQQMSSCFIIHMSDDSIDGIYKTLTDCAKISQHAGGIGLSIHNIRARGSKISGTNGVSSGIVPMLRVFNNTARYVDQGGGKRKGSIAIYIEPWHADIMEFLDLKKNTGAEEHRARDLFYGLWIPDLFMKRVENNESWSLMCPKDCKELYQVYGEQFDEIYTKYEQDPLKVRRVLPARSIWEKILISQNETGTPYMLYKDSVNKKSNQKNIGIIKSSNLCTEITEYTDTKEIAVCNLASLSLPKFVCSDDFINDGDLRFDFKLLHSITQHIVHNLNRIIDRNYYPLSEANASNMKYRPIGIGVQGLADVFALMRHSFTDEKAKLLNRRIFETIYHAAITASVGEAKKSGPYEKFKGSPLSEGLFQFDLWESPTELTWDWDQLRVLVKQYGVRNSLLIALMPTASTAQIMGNNESFEPFTSNIYVKRVLSGEFVVPNKYLMKDLSRLNLWSQSMKEALLRENGSIQNLNVPDQLKDMYKTVWELKMKDIIDMAADRARFIDQSQSMNLFVATPTINQLSSMHMYSWKKGLKTGMYYLRTKGASSAVKVTIEPDSEAACQYRSKKWYAAANGESGECVSCSS